MKILITLLGLLSIAGTATAQDETIKKSIEKGLRASPIGRLLKNKANTDIVDEIKKINRWIDEKPAYAVKSKKKELKECMGKSKIISNETINCYYGE